MSLPALNTCTMDDVFASIAPAQKTYVLDVFGSPIFQDDSKEMHDRHSQTMPVDPLALVLHWRAEGQKTKSPKFINLEIHAALEYHPGIPEKNYPTVAQEFIDQAEVINRHFRNKLLMAGLRGYPISAFRIALLDHLENPLNLVNKHIKILLRLPDFYQEDIAMQNLMLKYDTADGLTSLDTSIEYVTTVDRVVSNRPHKRHYFKTNENNLICFHLEPDNVILPFMQYIVKEKRQVSFRGTVNMHNANGYPDFNFYMTGSNNYELY